MQHKTLIASLVTTCTLFLSAATPAAPPSAFTPAQKPDRYDTPDSAANTAELARTDVLAQALGLTGTPGLVVMPVNAVRPEAITVFAGRVSAEKILAAIRKARQHP